MNKLIASVPEYPETVLLDGVTYGHFVQNQSIWLLGSTNNNWRAELIRAGSNPSLEDLYAAELKGIFLKQLQTVTPLAVMCCGLGSAWPGMGRELYDNFPACRNAMDEIASYADWDILQLMDEKEQDVINQTRKQIPYLFMLEYAQWSQYVSLGLKPDLIAGHSLGELIALCLAGVYSPRTAWHLLDTRALHMSALASRLSRKGGMLAVSATEKTVKEIIGNYPDIHIANRNTPHQYILSGFVDELSIIRKSLRKQRIPAILLNFDLAFHNPLMSILRDISFRRLEALEMMPPQTPVISCITGNAYSASQKVICSYITDLDENTVDWPLSLDKMANQYHIKTFLELGPRETLCSITAENNSRAICISSARKGAETEAMRQACARLYSMGLLKYSAIQSLKQMNRIIYPPVFKKENSENPYHLEDYSKLSEVNDILAIIADAIQLPKEKLGLNLDLRQDLGIRSSRFPFLIQQIEDKLNKQIPLEKLLNISTAGDLAYILLDKKTTVQKKEKTEFPFLRCQPLNRFSLSGHKLHTAFINPAHITNFLEYGDVFALCLADKELLPQIGMGLAFMGITLAIPASQLLECGIFEKNRTQLLPINFSMETDPEEAAMELLKACKGKIKAAVFSADIYDSQTDSAVWQAQTTYIDRLIEALPEDIRIIVIQRFTNADSLECAEDFLFKPLRHNGCRIAWLDERICKFLENYDEPSDLLMLELFKNSDEPVLWQRKSLQTSRYCMSSSSFYFVYPSEKRNSHDGASVFYGHCQLSPYGDALIEEHGTKASFSPLINYMDEKDFAGLPWLPVSYMLNILQKSSQILFPWLLTRGFADIELSGIPAFPSGVTRLCDIFAQAAYWLPMEGKNTRICRIQTQYEAIAVNGRALGNKLPLINGCSILGSKKTQPAAIKKIFTGLLQKNKWIEPEYLENFYKLLGMGNAWRFLKKFRYYKNNLSDVIMPDAEAIFELPQSFIAAKRNYDYNYVFTLIDGIIQLVYAVIAMPDTDICKPDQKKLEKWKLCTIGYILFNEYARLESKQVRIYLRNSWADKNVQRFDSEILEEDGTPLMTVHHLEFGQAHQLDK